MRRHRKAQEEGYTIIIVALLLFVFLGFCALAVDVGIADSARTSAQRAADAAALAGAFTFVVDPTSPQPATAQNHATAMATQNKIMGATIAAGDVTVAVDTATHRVTVVVNHTQSPFFARALGSDSFTVSATGIAEAAISAIGSGCLKPFFIPNTALSALTPCNGATGACDVSPKQVLIDKVNGVNQVTNWGLTQIQNGINGSTSNQFLLKPQNPGNALRPGDFFEIDFNGASIDTTISTCVTDPGFCAHTYSVLTGNRVGPVKSGIQNLIGCPGTIDTYVAPGQYRHAGNTISDLSQSLVACPIWDVCNATLNGTSFCPAGDFPGGTQVQLEIVGFALVFVEGLRTGNGTIGCSGNDAIGRVVGLAACSGQGGGGGGGGINPNETGPFGVPIRLIRTS